MYSRLYTSDVTIYRWSGVWPRIVSIAPAAAIAFLLMLFPSLCYADRIILFSPDDSSPAASAASGSSLRFVSPERLKEIETAIAPATLVPVGGRPGVYMVNVRVREAGLADLLEHSWLLLDAWSLSPDQDEPVWSRAPVPLELMDVTQYQPEFNSTFSLRLAFGDEDRVAGPMGSLTWSEAMDRRLDFDGRLGLARLRENAPEKSAGMFDGYVLGYVNGTIPEYTQEALSQVADQPFHPLQTGMVEVRGTVKRILPALANWERHYPPGDSDFADNAIGAVGWLCSLDRVAVRTTYSDDASPIEARRQKAKLVALEARNNLLFLLEGADSVFPSPASDTKRTAAFETFVEAMRRASDKDERLKGQLTSLVDSVQRRRQQNASHVIPLLPSEPSDLAYWSMKILREEPACAFWRSPIDSSEQRPFASESERTLIRTLLGLSTARVNAVDKPIPDFRLSDNRGLGLETAVKAGFVQPQGTVTPLQAEARETIVGLLRPDLSHPKIRYFRLRSDARRAMVRHQQALCWHSSPQDELRRARRLIFIILGRRQLPIGYPCMDLTSVHTYALEGRSPGGSNFDPLGPTNEWALSLVLLALYAGEKPLFGKTSDGDFVSDRLTVAIDAAAEGGRLSGGEQQVMWYLSAMADGKITKKFDSDRLHDAVRKVSAQVREIILTMPPDAAELAIYELAHQAVMAVHSWLEQQRD